MKLYLKNLNKATFIYFLIISIWMASLIAATLLEPKDSIKDLSGIVGREDNKEENKKMNGFSSFVYKAGDLNCHQLKNRSFFINGNQMPFCTRCIGIFLGFSVGALFIMIRYKELNPTLLILGLVPIGVDGLVQLFTSYESNNYLRFATGFFVGIVTSLAVGMIIFEVGEIKKMRNFKKQKKVDSKKDGGLI